MRGSSSLLSLLLLACAGFTSAARAADQPVTVTISLTNTTLLDSFLDANTRTRIDVNGQRDVQGNLANVTYKVFKGSKTEPVLEGSITEATGRSALSIRSFSGRSAMIRLDGIAVLNPAGTQGAAGTNDYSESQPRTMVLYRIGKGSAKQIASTEIPVATSYTYNPVDQTFETASSTEETIVDKGSGFAKKSTVATSPSAPETHTFTSLTPRLTPTPKTATGLIAPYTFIRIRPNGTTNIYYRTRYPQYANGLVEGDLPPIDYEVRTESYLSDNGKTAVFSSFAGQVVLDERNGGRVTTSTVTFSQTYQPF